MTDTTTPAVSEAPAPSLGETLYPAEGTSTPAVETPVTEAPAEPVVETAPAAEPPVEEAPDPAAPAEPASIDPASYKLEAEGITLNPELLTAARTELAAAGVPPEAAPALMSILKQSLEAQAAAQTAAFTTLNAKWTTESEALPEFQGERKAQSLAIIGRAVDDYGSPEVREAFALTGAGNNPAVVKFILGMATALTEGSPTRQGTPAAPRQNRSIGQRLYPDTAN